MEAYEAEEAEERKVAPRLRSLPSSGQAGQASDEWPAFVRKGGLRRGKRAERSPGGLHSLGMSTIGECSFCFD